MKVFYLVLIGQLILTSCRINRELYDSEIQGYMKELKVAEVTDLSDKAGPGFRGRFKGALKVERNTDSTVVRVSLNMTSGYLGSMESEYLLINGKLVYYRGLLVERRMLPDDPGTFQVTEVVNRYSSDSVGVEMVREIFTKSSSLTTEDISRLHYRKPSIENLNRWDYVASMRKLTYIQSLKDSAIKDFELALLDRPTIPDPDITIVDIGEIDRIGLGRLIREVSKYSPKIIAMDFLLVNDSLAKDSVLERELAKLDNTVQIVALHGGKYENDPWDSLEVSHPKFRASARGYSNISVEDSVIDREMPLGQFYGKRQVMALSYVVAEQTFGVKAFYKQNAFDYVPFMDDFVGHYFRVITRQEVTNGDFDHKNLSDKIVFLGYMGDREDWFYLDKERTDRISGVEVHASLVRAIIDR